MAQREQGRAEPQIAGDEASTLMGSPERQRATLAWKCGGLDASGVALGGRGHPDQLQALWQDAVARSRSLVAEALAEGGLDHVGRYTTPSGESPNLRRILIDLIEEYARHVGHADLIRESVDGLTGEGPPG